MKTRWILSAAGCLCFAGCTVGPDYVAPKMAMPESFTDPVAGTAATRATTIPTTRPVDLARWWESMDDPELNSLIHRAIVNGYDLRIAVARFQQARAVEYATTGGLLSGVGSFNGVNLSGSIARGSGNDSTRGRIDGPLHAGAATAGLKEITQVIGFDAGWEVDVFGRYTRLSEAYAADTQAFLEARNQVLVSLVADVVRAYVEVRTLQVRLEIAQRNVAAQERSLNVVRTLLQQFIGNELNVALAERQLAAARSRVAPIEAGIAAAERRVAVLVGQMPGTLRAELNRPSLMPALPPGVAVGMPADLLRRRPDIRRLERQLAGATAKVGVATADLFPRIGLSGAIGVQGQGLGVEPERAKSIYSIGPSLYWPFLDFGSLDALLQVQNFRSQELLFTYQQTVINAVREVDDALNNYTAEQDRLSHLGEAVAASRRAVSLATQRFENGLTDFLNVLDAQRQLYDLEDQYAIAQQSMSNQFVALYKALGGGWEGYEVPAPPIFRPTILAAMDAMGKQKKMP